jgi:hypothetical protein
MLVVIEDATRNDHTHCTGWRAVNALGNMFGDTVVSSAVGRIYSFGESK